jgi:hypothetical protein
VFEPVGPLPAAIYWRRRAVVAVAALLVLIIGWQLLPGGGGDDPRRTAGAAGSPTATPIVAPSTSLGATPPPGDPGRPGNGSPATTTPTATTPAPTTPAPTTPPPPGPCADGALALRVVPQRPEYRVGQTPVLGLEVRNTSKAPCVRDLGAAQQEIVLYAGGTRLWSSNDCYPEGERDSRVLRPGAAESFSVTWSGLGSRPKCAGTRARVGPGTYQLVGRLGTLISKRTALVLR